MAIYNQLGIRPFINAGGWTYTRYGGSIMPDAVVAAMAEASRNFVNIFDLQDTIGRKIAEMTSNEAAFISCGAASGILLSVAACIAGTDPALADRLPDTQGMRNRIIMRTCDRGTEADPAIRAAGGKIIDVGSRERPPRSGEILAAIDDQTAAIVLLASHADIRKICDGARARNVPVLIDGAGALPPRENLWCFTRDMGADAFITSGGKAIRGPQSTGLVLGKRAIIEGCKYHSSPNLRIGRGMKVGKEEFAGIYTALKLFLAQDTAAIAKERAMQIAHVADALKGIGGTTLTVSADGSELDIDFDPAVIRTIGEQIEKSLLAGDPSILLRARGNKITIRAALLQPGEEEIVATTLREFLRALSAPGK